MVVFFYQFSYVLVFSVEVAVADAVAATVVAASVVRPSVALLHAAALVVDADAAKLADIPTSRCDVQRDIVSPHLTHPTTTRTGPCSF